MYDRRQSINVSRAFYLKKAVRNKYVYSKILHNTAIRVTNNHSSIKTEGISEVIIYGRYWGLIGSGTLQNGVVVILKHKY